MRFRIKNKILTSAFIISLAVHGVGFMLIKIKTLEAVPMGEVIEVGLLESRWSEPFLELPGYSDDEREIFEPTDRLFLRSGPEDPDSRRPKARILELPDSKTQDLSSIRIDQPQKAEGPLLSPLGKEGRPDLDPKPVIRGPVAKRKILFRKYPDYPVWAQKYGIEFEVRLKFWVLPNGEVSGVVVENSSGYPEVDAEVIRAMKRWKFDEIEDRDQTAQWGTILFKFRLRP